MAMLSSFKIFRQEILTFFTATETLKKSKDVQVARLLNLIGSDARKIYYQIEDSIKDKSDWNNIINAIEKRCLPKKNVIMCQFKFLQRKQQESETFDQFFTELNELIKSCSFGECEENLMRTQIVLGISNKTTQQKLLGEGPQFG